MRHSGGGGGGGEVRAKFQQRHWSVEILTENAELIFRIHVTATEHNTHSKKTAQHSR